MPRWFGTDGIRGTSFEFPVDPPTFRAIGFFWGQRLRDEGAVEEVLVARDTRASSPALARGFMEGLSAAGCQILDLDVFPTPATIWLATRLQRYAAIITASHNLYPDNGLKLVQPDGTKIPEEVEEYIESCLQKPVPSSPTLRVKRFQQQATEIYTSFLLEVFAPLRDATPKPTLLLDVAYGATYVLYPQVLRALGYSVQVLHAEPDGTNINQQAGAVAPDRLLEAVRTCGTSPVWGFAYDGDGDRMIPVTPGNGVLDGHYVLAAITLYEKDRNGLGKRPAVVSTVMANQALEHFLRDRHIELIRTPVGDKYVYQAMTDYDLNLGAEPSGHLIHRRYSSTGDGLLTTLLFLTVWHHAPERIKEVLTGYHPYPQVLRNVRVARKPPLDQVSELRHIIALCRARLDDQGRVFVRYSGTEPVLRILVESQSAAMATHLADQIAEVAARVLGD